MLRQSALGLHRSARAMGERYLPAQTKGLMTRPKNAISSAYSPRARSVRGREAHPERRSSAVLKRRWAAHRPRRLSGNALRHPLRLCLRAPKSEARGPQVGKPRRPRIDLDTFGAARCHVALISLERWNATPSPNRVRFHARASCLRPAPADIPESGRYGPSWVPGGCGWIQQPGMQS